VKENILSSKFQIVVNLLILLILVIFIMSESYLHKTLNLENLFKTELFVTQREVCQRLNNAFLVIC